MVFILSLFFVKIQFFNHLSTYFEIQTDNIDKRSIEQVVELLRNGSVIIIPTDTVYAYACDIYSPQAIDKISKLKQTKIEKANFSFLMPGIDMISHFTKPFSRPVFKLLKRALPGPYTIILNAGSEVPQIFRSKKKSIGIRIPDHAVVQAILDRLGNPLMVTSLKNEDEIVEYMSDPSEIFEVYESKVDGIINCGYGGNVPSTIIDCSSDEPILLREGAGSTDVLQ